MLKVWCMRGFSGSGKSTRAREIANQHGAVVVNRDLLRLQLLGSWWTGHKEDEDRVTTAEDAQVRALLKSGVSVVIDATHLAPQYLRKWARLASRQGAEFHVEDVHCDPAVAKHRVWKRWAENQESPDARYLEPKVVDDQVKRFPVEKWPEVKADPPFVVKPAEWVEGLPSAIIVDIDGTLAHMTGRSPYDYSRVDEDSVDETIRGITWMWSDDPNHEGEERRHILIVSGRDDSCREATRKWLASNDVYYDHLWMRPAGAVDSHGGKLPDYVVKYDLFNEHIRGRYNVEFVLDDRDQVVDVWRRLGLKCLQVAPGDF